MTASQNIKQHVENAKHTQAAEAGSAVADCWRTL